MISKKKRIYMDNAATTKVKDEVIEAMLPYFVKEYGNPSSIHEYGQNAKEAVNKARATIATTLNAKPEEIYFTSGGSESDNWAIDIAIKTRKGNHIITSKIEHHAILKKCEELERLGYEVTYLSVDEGGQVNLRELINAIRKDTILISVMTANNEIGTIQPIERIGKIAKERKILFHTDAVCAYTKLPIDVKKCHIDMLSASGHKIEGPKGVGLLYVSENVKIEPMIFGGMQENGKRAGTTNVPGIIGMAVAAKLRMESIRTRIVKERIIQDYFVENVLKRIPFARLNGHRVNRLSGNVNMGFQFIEGQSLVVLLNDDGISCSSGSACNQESSTPSHVLMAIGVPSEIAYSSIRFTFDENTTKNDIDYVIMHLEKHIRNLREKSIEYKKVIGNINREV